MIAVIIKCEYGYRVWAETSDNERYSGMNYLYPDGSWKNGDRYYFTEMQEVLAAIDLVGCEFRKSKLDLPGYDYDWDILLARSKMSEKCQQLS